MSRIICRSAGAGNTIDAMPFKSQAQRRKFAQLLVEGKISPETYEEWNRETGGLALPERVTATKTAARKRKATKKKTAATKKTTKRKTPAGKKTAKKR